MEGFYVANSILDTALCEQKAYSDFAILYRTNAQSRIFEDALRKRNIPYKVYGGLSFYQRKEIKDMLAYLRLAVNHNDDEALRRIINYPARGIGETTFRKLETIAAQQGKSIWAVLENTTDPALSLNKGTISKLQQFSQMIKGFASVASEQDAFEASQLISQASGLKKDLYLGKSIEERSRYENLEALINGIREFVEAAKNDNQPVNLSSFLENIALITDLDMEEPDDRNYVTIMTVHSAKGLEFNNVFIAGVEEELFPSRHSSESAEELEEERRLFYVAITRAKKRVYITCAKNRYRWGSPVFCEPSRFIEDLDPGYIEYTPGKTFGNNTSFNRAAKRDFESSWNNKMNYGPREINSGKSAISKTGTTTNPFIPNKTQIKPARSENFVPSDPALIQTDMHVEHDRFGAGKILSVEGDHPNRKAKVLFSETGEEKQLLLKFARLKIIDGKE